MHHNCIWIVSNGTTWYYNNYRAKLGCAMILKSARSEQTAKFAPSTLVAFEKKKKNEKN
jgi:hypothetical protein